MSFTGCDVQVRRCSYIVGEVVDELDLLEHVYLSGHMEFRLKRRSNGYRRLSTPEMTPSVVPRRRKNRSSWSLTMQQVELDVSPHIPVLLVLRFLPNSKLTDWMFRMNIELYQNP